jgi:hypothetical protein
MKKYIFIFLLLQTSFFNAQTNLICNPSFEEFDPQVVEDLNMAQKFYTNHLKFSSSGSLFPCWEQQDGNGVISPNDCVGFTFGIVPGLFPIGNHQLGMFEPSIYPNLLPYFDLDFFYDPPRVLTSASYPVSNSFQLDASPTNNLEFGMDLSAPNSFFADNFQPSQGSNCLALFDFSTEFMDGHSIIITKLKYPLVKDVNYEFKIDVALMNKLNEIKNENNFSNIKKAKLNIWWCDENGNHKQKILDNREVDDINWNTVTRNYEANRNHTHLLIEFDPLPNNNQQNGKISGIFIDNLKLYESCETPVNQCDNQNYREDMLDVNLEKVKLYDNSTFPENLNSNETAGYIKTIRVNNLQNVRKMVIIILDNNSNHVLEETVEYPSDTWVWDGRDDNGVVMPDGHYTAWISQLYNDCHSRPDADTKSFHKSSHFRLFDPSTSISQVDGNTIIYGLQNVNNLNVKLYSSNGSLVYNYDLNNPPAQIGISTTALNNYTNVQNSTVAAGNYLLKLNLSNNCGNVEMTLNNINIVATLQSGPPVYNQLFNWDPVAKPQFICPFDLNYHDNYLAPMNCCEGTLYLSDVEIWNSWDVNILQNIEIGPNVTFVNGRDNNLYAGQQIILHPDGTGVKLNPDTFLKPNTFNCTLCKTYVVSDDSENLESNFDYLKEMDSLNNVSIIYPNPYVQQNTDESIKIKLGINSFIHSDDCTLKLYNSIGVEYNLEIVRRGNRIIDFVLLDNMTPGIYYILVESQKNREFLSLLIK